MKTLILIAVLLATGCAVIAQVPPPPPATAAEATAGTVKNKYISPYTLATTISGVTGPTNGVTAATVTNIADAKVRSLAILQGQATGASIANSFTVTGAGSGLWCETTGYVGIFGGVYLNHVSAGVGRLDGWAMGTQTGSLLLSNVFAKKLYGDAIGVTNVQATNIVGVVHPNNLPNVVTNTQTTLQVGENGGAAGVIQFWDDMLGSYAVVYIKEGVMEVGATSLRTTGEITALNGFTGYGNGITDLNASELASGTVPLERLSGITSNQLDAATWELAAGRGYYTTNFNIPAAGATNWTVTLPVAATNYLVTAELFLLAKSTNPNGVTIASGDTLPCALVSGYTYPQSPFSVAGGADLKTYRVAFDGDDCRLVDGTGTPITLTVLSGYLQNAFQLQARFTWTIKR